jgi:hypothetical protein
MKCAKNIRGPVRLLSCNLKKILDNNEFGLIILIIKVWIDEKIKYDI